MKSTESVPLLELLIPSLPSRDPLSQNLRLEGSDFEFLIPGSQKYPDFCNRGTLHGSRIGLTVLFFFRMSAFQVKVTRTVEGTLFKRS